MRDRLIRLLCSVKCEGADRREGGCPRRVDDECANINKLEMCMIETIADHLLANGVIVPMCKVGDMVYFPMETNGECEPYIDVGQVFNISIDKRLTMWVSVHYESGLKYYHTSGNFGKTVFLAREEAEQALKGDHHAEIH